MPQHSPKSSVENVHLKLTLLHDRNHNLHLSPLLRWTPFDFICACSLGLHDWDVAFINAILHILGAAIGRIGEQETAFIRRDLCRGWLRTPKIPLLRWTAVATRVMRRRRRPLRRRRGGFG